MSRRTTSPTARLLTAALLCVLASAPVWSVEPRFHIQAIEVRGARHVSSGIVVSESLLEAGRVYTESDLRDAVHRVHRLPFVLEADFALEKGRERNTYVLVVDVRDAKRLFYQAGLRQSSFSDPVAFDAGAASTDETAATATVGTRLFLGGYGLLFAAAGDAGVELGYTRYNLFGRGVFLSFGAAVESCCAVDLTPLGLDPAFSSWIDAEDSPRAALTVGVPLAGNHALRGSVALRQSDAGSRRGAVGRAAPGDVFDYEDRAQEELRLAWLYDTTDDPVFPFAGTSVVVAVDYQTLEADLVAAANLSAPAEMSSELFRVSVLGRRHWPFARRHAFAVGLALAVGRSDVENLPLQAGELVDASLDLWEVSATIRHSMKLGEAKTARFRQLYWRNVLEVSVDGTSPDRDLPYGSLEVLALSSELVYRNAWGIVSVGFRLVELGDVL